MDDGSGTTGESTEGLEGAGRGGGGGAVGDLWLCVYAGDGGEVLLGVGAVGAGLAVVGAGGDVLARGGAEALGREGDDGGTVCRQSCTRGMDVAVHAEWEGEPAEPGDAVLDDDLCA